MLGFGAMECDLNLSPQGDLTEAAANLFPHLHSLGRIAPYRALLWPRSPKPDWAAPSMTALRRAAAPRPVKLSRTQASSCLKYPRAERMSDPASGAPCRR
jgi:hypothetical protein